ncbi:wax ester synthase/diacylglycerol acyltransferase 11-like [Cornus florida]|uniref:wax ester synthase/diacylglycerol acyltransferase 11-like n=1 Tax=Cornus florida TaxID=4283 RepID=UPI0028998F1B|nr:wax ester synthase/diacylglycerol acyltransferase 11-like [Cornus florida]
MARLFHEPGSNVYIISMLGSTTKIYPDVVKANLEHTLLMHPRFSSLQVVDKENGGEMKWVPVKVNLDNHVIVPELNPNMGPPDKIVEDYISNLSKTTIPKSRPLWDLHLLNIKTSDAEALGVFRIHHSIGDGMSLMSLLLACCVKASNPQALPTIPVMKSSTSNNSRGFWSVIQLVWNTIVGVLMFVATALFLKDTKTPLKGSRGVENNPRRFIHRTVGLEDVKLIKNAMNITINDVVVGVTQAALSRYLNRKYGEIRKEKGATEKKNYLPNNIRLRATFFINIRPSVGIHALFDMMKKGTKVRWGNKIGYVLLPFTIALRDDPLDYVREAKSVIDQKKASFESVCTYIITKLIIKFFGIKAAGVLNYKLFSNTTLWFSNVPGPQEEIAFCGHSMAYVAPSCFGQPNALMIHVVSYIDKLTFMISADEGTIPDPQQLCDDLEHSLNLIKSAVLAKDRSVLHQE